LSAYPNLAATDQESALLNSAVDLVASGPDDIFGYGRLDLLTTFNWLATAPTATPFPMHRIHLMTAQVSPVMKLSNSNSSTLILLMTANMEYRISKVSLRNRPRYSLTQLRSPQMKRRRRGSTGMSIGNPELQVAVALAIHRLLDQINKILGTDENGTIDAASLAEWLTEVRRSRHVNARADIGDHCLGKLLAKTTDGENGIWPFEEVYEVIEAKVSPEIGWGFHIGFYISRGVHSRGGGGEQEREAWEQDSEAKISRRLHY
jgi:hypothetical protein